MSERDKSAADGPAKRASSAGTKLLRLEEKTGMRTEFQSLSITSVTTEDFESPSALPSGLSSLPSQERPSTPRDKPGEQEHCGLPATGVHCCSQMLFPEAEGTVKTNTFNVPQRSPQRGGL